MKIQTALGEFLASTVSIQGKQVYKILSIPYAKGELFSPSTPIESYTGTINSLQSKCFPQRKIPRFANVFLKHHMMRKEFATDTDEQTKDAFVLNVFTESTEGKRPVLVFIHGGGDYGSGTTPIYDGSYLAGQGLVVVCVTYRMGLAGYLPIFENGQANCNRALKDQQNALLWVRKNIGHLGGDVENICLMGHSGGALSSLNQFLNPTSQKLFDKLILCGGPLPTAISREEGEQVYKDFLEANRLQSAEELQKLSIAQIRKLKFRKYMKEVVDGDFFPQDPKAILEEGNFPNIPVLLGANSDEFSMIEMPMMYKAMGILRKEKGLEKHLEKRYGELSLPLQLALEPEAENPVDLQMKILELGLFHSVSYKLVQKFAEKNPVYAYRFCYVPNLYNGLRGAYHGAEVAMFFHNLDKMNIYITEENKQEMEWVTEDWLSFVKTGKIPQREHYQEKQEIILYDGAPHMMAFPHAELIEKLLQSDVYETSFAKFLENR